MDDVEWIGEGLVKKFTCHGHIGVIDYAFSHNGGRDRDIEFIRKIEGILERAKKWPSMPGYNDQVAKSVECARSILDELKKKTGVE